MRLKKMIKNCNSKGSNIEDNIYQVKNGNRGGGGGEEDGFESKLELGISLYEMVLMLVSVNISKSSIKIL